MIAVSMRWSGPHPVGPRWYSSSRTMQNQSQSKNISYSTLAASGTEQRKRRHGVESQAMNPDLTMASELCAGPVTNWGMLVPRVGVLLINTTTASIFTTCGGYIS